MNLYYTIAEQNPEGTYNLCADYGYNPQSADEAAQHLYEIFSSGDDGFIAVMSIHPHQEAMVDYIKLVPAANCGNGVSEECAKRIQSMKQYMGSDGKKAIAVNEIIKTKQKATSFFTPEHIIMGAGITLFSILTVAFIANNKSA